MTKEEEKNKVTFLGCVGILLASLIGFVVVAIGAGLFLRIVREIAGF